MAKNVKPTIIEQVFSLRESDVVEKYASLTRREKEVAALLGRDLKNKEIADQLEISPKTLDIHRAMLKRKLAVRNSATIANYAMFHRYITLNKGARAAEAQAS